jgi:hypothetical protein
MLVLQYSLVLVADLELNAALPTIQVAVMLEFFFDYRFRLIIQLTAVIMSALFCCERCFSVCLCGGNSCSVCAALSCTACCTVFGDMYC